jgi:hypothetical protein
VLLVEQAVGRPVEVEQVADTLVAALAAASLVAVAYRISERSAGHQYFAALRISYPRDDPLHRLIHLLQLSSRVVFFLFF